MVRIATLRPLRHTGWWWAIPLAAAVVLVSLVGCARLGDPWHDARIESEVKARLVAERSANLTRVGVVSRDGVVQLSGAVASAEDRALAENLTASVGGVRRVLNGLDVSPAPAGSR